MHPSSYLFAISTGLALVSATAIQQAITGYSYIGCYTDSAAGRALTGSANAAASANDATYCSSYCGGTTYFGLEDGKNEPDYNFCPGFSLIWEYQ